MPSLATTADLATYLRRDGFTPGTENDQAQLALDLATAVVRARTGQDFTVETGDTVTLDTHGEQDVWLPQRPVNAVTSVTTRDLGSATTTARTLNVDYERRGPRLRWVGVGGWPYEITVVYDHGYATIPDDVRAATLAVAAELHANPDGLSSETVDDYTWRRNENEDTSLAQRMLAMLERRYARRPLSVRLA